MELFVSFYTLYLVGGFWSTFCARQFVPWVDMEENGIFSTATFLTPFPLIFPVLCGMYMKAEKC